MFTKIPESLLTAFLLPVFCLLMTADSTELCLDMDYQRRNALDGFKYTSHLISDTLSLSKVECSQKCLEIAKCNLVLHHEANEHCRLYKHVFNSRNNGIDESGWEFYGASCDSYRLEDAKPDVNVLTTSSEDLCVDGYQAVCESGFSCWDGGSWKTVPFRCLKFLDVPMLNLQPTKNHAVNLDFDLDTGISILFEVHGNTANSNTVKLEAGGFIHYLLSIRWVHDQLVFNTMLSAGWGAEVYTSPIPVSNPNRFTMQIQISETDLMTYMDGVLIQTNEKRAAMVGVRRIVLEAFLAIYRFEIDKGSAC